MSDGVVNQCVMVGDRELNAAIATLHESGHIDFINQMEMALTGSTEYVKMTEGAVEILNLNRSSLSIGIKVGLRIAAALGNFNYQFLLSEEKAAEHDGDIDSNAGAERSVHVSLEHQSGECINGVCSLAIHG